MPSPEEMAKIEKERVLSDTEPLKGGAEYKFNEKGEKFLVTEEQIIKETRLEKTVDDLGVYVKLHKEIELPYTEISDENLKSDALLKRVIILSLDTKRKTIRLLVLILFIILQQMETVLP